jgi:hypothetical protein
MSAFLSYSKEMRPKIRQEFPGMKNADVSVVLAQRWRAASDAEKKPHVDQEKQDRQKYYRDLAVFKAAEEERIREEEADRKRQGTRETIEFLNLPAQLNWTSGSSNDSQSYSGSQHGSSCNSQVGSSADVDRSDDEAEAAAKDQDGSAEPRPKKPRRESTKRSPAGEASGERPELYTWAQLTEPSSSSSSARPGADGTWSRWSPSPSGPNAASPHANIHVSEVPSGSGSKTSSTAQTAPGGVPGAGRSSRDSSPLGSVLFASAAPTAASSAPDHAAAPLIASPAASEVRTGRTHSRRGSRGHSTMRCCRSPCSDSSHLSDAVHEGLSAYVSYLDHDAPQHRPSHAQPRPHPQQVESQGGHETRPSKRKHNRVDNDWAPTQTTGAASAAPVPMNVVPLTMPMSVSMPTPFPESMAIAGAYPRYMSHAYNGPPLAPAPYTGYCVLPPELMLYPPHKPAEGPQPPGADLWETMLAQQQHQQWYMPGAFYFMVGDESSGSDGAGGRRPLPANASTSPASAGSGNESGASVDAVKAESIASGNSGIPSVSTDSGVVSPLTNPSTSTDANVSPRAAPVSAVTESCSSVNGGSTGGHTTGSASTGASAARGAHRPEYQALRTLYAVNNAGLYDWAAITKRPAKPTNGPAPTSDEQSQSRLLATLAALPAGVSSSSSSNSSRSGTRKSSASYVPTVTFANTLPPGWH